MKFKYLFIASLSLFMSSCTGDWLDVESEGNANESTFWKTDDHYIAACNTIYNELAHEETWGRDLFWEQAASDDIILSRTQGGKRTDMATFNCDGSTESPLFNFYDYMYQNMAKCNNIIYHGLKLGSKSEVIKRSIGEAYFMRAFSHFMIAYRYGTKDNGVPFERYEDSEEYVTSIPKQQASVLDNYKMIVEDLDKAIEYLPCFKEYSSDNYGRASKDAAYALKVKALAYWAMFDKSKWSEIPAIVDKISTECGRSLVPSFKDLWTIDNNWSSEYIFSVNSSGSNYAGSIFPGILLDNKGWGVYNGWGNFKPSLELLAEYEDNDERKAVTLLQYGDEFTYFGQTKNFYSDGDVEVGLMFNKYMEPYKYGSNGDAATNSHISTNGDRPTTDLNIPILRYAEMLLFKAEAYIMTGETSKAAAPLNEIAKRAGLGANKYSNPTMKDLMHECRCELAGEFYDRTMDLKRWYLGVGTDAATKADAKARLVGAKHGIKHLNRSAPFSAVDEANGTTMTINGKTFKGVFVPYAEAMGDRSANWDDNVDAVFPYRVNEVVKSMGALKQNNGYPSK